MEAYSKDNSWNTTETSCNGEITGDDSDAVNSDSAKTLKKAEDYLSKCARFKDFVMKKLAENKAMIERIDSAHSNGKKRKTKRVDEVPEYDIPYFTGKLRTYQIEGVKWLKSHDLASLNGILADDMGLGKTVQCIAFLCDLIREGIVGPFCIVAPYATLDNWESEFKRFAPKVPVLIYHGTKDERKKMKQKFNQLQRVGSEKCYPIIICNYEVVMTEKSLFKSIEWRYLILDEGHRIKNSDGVTRRLMKQLPSSGRLLLTGTPVQNNIEELWSLLNFVMPELFSDKEWFKEYFDFGCVMRSADTSAVEACKEIVERIHDILDPFILRRMKTDVEQQLPRKNEFVVYTPLSELQIEPSRKLRRLDKSSTAVPIDLKIENFFSKKRICPMTFRHIANHPFLLNDVESEKASGADLVNNSGKMMIMDKLLQSLFREGGHKVLIFSQFVEMIDLLEWYCEYRRFEYRSYHGQMSGASRQQSLRDFNDDANVFILLLSTRAGGLGLNLMAADTNPQCDNQATDRCYRIGQNKPVNAYRLVARGTIDEIMVQRASGKQRLELAIVEAGRLSMFVM
ncbi:lymphoid specific helicase [Trichuris trichiura]|uniref:Lymphoid specific helicase n=1 Tax=Trichuris trichiura TaxID=36087 RepID=A0A077YY16_TRITR|nr:lymphoid specific helicase [Trichuris trichiura]